MYSAEGSDILLKETETTRLYFRPEIIDNLNNPKACVKGKFIHQRKGANDNWDDLETFSCASLESGQAVTLPLNTEATLNLIEGLIEFKNIHDKNGVQYGEREYVHASKDIASIAEQLADLENAEDVINNLKILTPETLQNLNTVVGITRLQNALDLWDENEDNDNEEFWHETIRDNSWLIAQVMLHPVIIFEDKAYVGGKGLDNTGGKVPDFLFKNKQTANVLILEIKTPLSRILGKSYRDTYALNSHLSGAINQTLIYKQMLLNEFRSLARNSKEKFETFDPKCVLITGHTRELDEDNKIGAFELFRSQLKHVDIITYDELFAKTRALLELLAERIVEDEDDDRCELIKP